MPSGTFTGAVNRIFIEPELENLSIRVSGGRESLLLDSAACFWTSSRCRRTSFLTLGTPVVSRATRGTGTNTFASGISSTGVLTISACSTSKGGTSSTSPPGMDTDFGIDACALVWTCSPIVSSSAAVLPSASESEAPSASASVSSPPLLSSVSILI